jgi:hypothetical protein
VNSAWRKISIPSARVLHRSCTRASWDAVTRAKARRGASVAWFGLRQAGAFLLKSKFVGTLPLTLSSARGVTSAEGPGVRIHHGVLV